MKRLLCSLLVVALSVLWLAAPAHGADDSVTIPKSQLEELQRKAAELERLQRELNKAAATNAALQKARADAEAKAASEAAAAAAAREAAEKAAKDAQAAAAKANAEAEAAAAARAAALKADEEARAALARANMAATNPPTYVAPPMASLPPLGSNDVISSMDLLSHFITDERAARERYAAKGEKICVEGEIVGFKCVPFYSPYAVLLKSGNPGKHVEVWFVPPDRYKAVFTKQNGSQLVGVRKDRGNEVKLFRTGQTLTVVATCGKLEETGLSLDKVEVKSVR